MKLVVGVIVITSCIIITTSMYTPVCSAYMVNNIVTVIMCRSNITCYGKQLNHTNINHGDTHLATSLLAHDSLSHHWSTL